MILLKVFTAFLNTGLSLALLDEESLKTYLISTCGLGSKSRPVERFNDALIIEVFLLPFRFRELDSREQRFSVITEIDFKWRHPRCRWNPTAWGNASSVRIKGRDTWYPVVQHVNAIDDMSLDKTLRQADFEVSHDGIVTVPVILFMASFCQLK